MKMFRLALMAIVFPIVISIACCSSATATPTGTVNAWIDALVDLNPQAIVSYETEDYAEMTPVDRIEMYGMAFAGIKSSSATNRELVVESETETSATVSVSFTFSATDIDDNTQEEDISATYTLTKVDGKWLMSFE